MKKIGLILFVLLLTGCASLLKSRYEQVTFKFTNKLSATITSMTTYRYDGHLACKMEMTATNLTAGMMRPHIKIIFLDDNGNTKGEAYFKFPPIDSQRNATVRGNAYYNDCDAGSFRSRVDYLPI